MRTATATATARRARVAGLAALALALTLLPALAAGGETDEQLKVGVATEDITWRVGASQSGWGERMRINHLDNQGVETNMSSRLYKPSEGVHMPLRTKAIVFEQGERRIAIVSLDLLGSIQLLHVGVARAIAEDPGIAWDDLLLVGTHTEAGPSNGSPSPLIAVYADLFDEEFARYVTERTVTAIRRAAEAAEPARVAVGSRANLEQLGSFVGEDQPDRHFDDELGVARFDRLDGSTIATLVTYPGHFNLGGNPARLVSPDGPGLVEHMVESDVAGLDRQQGQPHTAVFLPGPLGDSAVTGSGESNIYARLEERSRLLADHTLEVLEAIEPADAGHDAIDSRAAYVNPPPDYEVPRFPILEGAPTPFMVSHRMHTQVVKVGDLLLGGVPGEPVMWFAKDFKERTREVGAAHPFLISFGNDWTGYIYTRDQWHEGVSRSNQGAYGPEQGHVINDALVEQAKAILGHPADLDTGMAGPAQMADEPFYQAIELAVTETGPVGSPARDAAVVPNVVLECAGLDEPSDLARFERTQFAWRGGNPAADTPFVELQREDGEGWETVATSDGHELHTWLDIYHLRYGDPSLPGLEPGCNELADQIWWTEFEPAFDWPAGTYRLRAQGVFRQGPTLDEVYEATSEPFEVAPSSALAVTDVERDGDVLTFAIRYPNDEDGWRLRPAEATDGEAHVVIDGEPAGTATYDADRGAFVLENPPAGDEVEADYTDAWGNST